MTVLKVNVAGTWVPIGSGSGGGGMPAGGSVGDSLRTLTGGAAGWRPNVYIQPAAPSSPIVGDIWLDSDDALDGTLAATMLRLSSTAGGDPISTDHALQIGPDSSSNLRLNEHGIQKALNGVASDLYLNQYGGNVLVGLNGLNLVPTAWTALVMQGSWANYDANTYAAAAYRKIGDVVYLRGLIKGGATGSLIASMSTGFRPTKFLHIVTAASDAVAVMRMQSDGGLYCTAGNVTGWLSLDSVSWSTV